MAENDVPKWIKDTVDTHTRTLAKHDTKFALLEKQDDDHTTSIVNIREHNATNQEKIMTKFDDLGDSLKPLIKEHEQRIGARDFFLQRLIPTISAIVAIAALTYSFYA